jgi:hypothetical protein
MAFTCCCSGGLSLPLLFLAFLELSECLLLVLLAALVLLNHSVAVQARAPTHAEVKQVVQVVDVLALSREVELNLAIELRDELALHGILPGPPEGALVHHHFECITLEQVQEVLRGNSREYLLLSPHLLVFVSPLLEVAPLALLHASLPGGLHPLRLEEFRLLHLQEEPLVLGELLALEVLDCFDLRKLQSLADQHLQDGFRLQFEVKEVVVLVVHLDQLRIALGVRDEDRRRLLKLSTVTGYLPAYRCSSQAPAVARQPCSLCRSARLYGEINDLIGYPRSAGSTCP